MTASTGDAVPASTRDAAAVITVPAGQQPPIVRESPADGQPTADQPRPGGAQDADVGDSEHVDAVPVAGGVRVDRRAVESALLELRARVDATEFPLEVAAAQEARAERSRLVAQIDDYLLPRLRRSSAPVLVSVVGSTGAGKSTLVNSIVGAQVSVTGVRRPTTNSPVLACHPDDVDAFAENNFLPALPRVRQEGLARPGRDGLLVLASASSMPRGLALLDTPDIDSVVAEHHAFAAKFLDASDLWLFVTSASRYADAAVWQVLQHARARKATLGVVLSRVPPRSAAQLSAHFAAMLDANDICVAERFVVPETLLVDDRLPPEVSEQVRTWLGDATGRQGRRVAVVSATMSGMLDTFRTRVPRLADHAEAQLASRSMLRTAAAEPYLRALAALGHASADGSLLRGAVAARWRDFLLAGDLVSAPSRKPVPAPVVTRTGLRARRRHPPERVAALAAAVRSALTSLLVLVADDAAEQVMLRWQDDPAGAALLATAAEAPAGGQRTGNDAAAITAATQPDAGAADDGETGAPDGRPPDRLAARAERVVDAWHDDVLRLVQDAVHAKRSVARRVSANDETLALVTVLSCLSAAAEGTAGDVVTVPRRMLDDLLGEQTGRDTVRTARAVLRERVKSLLDEELARFDTAVHAAGSCDELAAVWLHAAEYALEASR